MTKLNLNFHQKTGRCVPTKDEIIQIEGLALSVEAIIKMLEVYAEHGIEEEIGGYCVNVCQVLLLLMDPIIEYFGEYAGSGKGEETQ